MMAEQVQEIDLFQSLLAAQVELKAPKGQFNNFGKYKYRSAEDILEAVKPVNKKHGLTLTLSDEIEQFGDRFYIKATATITNGTQTHSVNAYAREALTKKGMDDSQITGTASSYARKYALNGLYLIDDTKDADTDEYTNQRNQQANYQQQTQPVTSKAIVQAKFKQLGGDAATDEAFNQWYAKQLENGVDNNGMDMFLTQKIMDGNK